MDRIARIRELEELSGNRDRATSAQKWETAHLYWLEVREDGRSYGDVARDIGKTRQHVMYMVRCWEVAIRTETGFSDYGSLPEFSRVYGSPEVRSPERDGEKRKGRKTVYNGIEFRSLLEADFAKALDRRGLEWTYEPRAYLAEGCGWIPDFAVDSPVYGGRVLIELKPDNFTTREVAGQIRRIAVAWESDPSAILQAVFWEYGVGAALVLTGRRGEWTASVSAA